MGMRLALVVAVLGILGTAMNVMQFGALIAGDAERPTAVFTSTITFALLILCEGLSIDSFVTARRRAAVEP